MAAGSSTTRLNCRVAAGSSNARTPRAPYSRWRENEAAALSDISSASHRAILPIALGRAMVLVSRGLTLDLSHAGAMNQSVGSPRFRAATKRKLTDRTLDVEFDPRHLREQIDIGVPDRASAEPHVGRHQVERLSQYADVLQNERICDASCTSMKSRPKRAAIVIRTWGAAGVSIANLAPVNSASSSCVRAPIGSQRVSASVVMIEILGQALRICRQPDRARARSSRQPTDTGLTACSTNGPPSPRSTLLFHLDRTRAVLLRNRESSASVIGLWSSKLRME